MSDAVYATISLALGGVALLFLAHSKFGRRWMRREMRWQYDFQRRWRQEPPTYELLHEAIDGFDRLGMPRHAELARTSLSQLERR